MEVPKILDWVKARAECSVEHLFILLTEVVESDVKGIQERTEASVTFKMTRLTESKIVVSKAVDISGWVDQVTVTFECTRLGIEVYGANREGPRPMFTARPSFDAAGPCRLDVDGQTFELWQVSRKALEDLFFS